MNVCRTEILRSWPSLESSLLGSPSTVQRVALYILALSSTIVKSIWSLEPQKLKVPMQFKGVPNVKTGCSGLHHQVKISLENLRLRIGSSQLGGVYLLVSQPTVLSIFPYQYEHMKMSTRLITAAHARLWQIQYLFIIVIVIFLKPLASPPANHLTHLKEYSIVKHKGPRSVHSLPVNDVYLSILWYKCTKFLNRVYRDVHLFACGWKPMVYNRNTINEFGTS